MGELKRCSTCALAKPTAEFHRRVKSTDGLAAACKVCASVAYRRRYAASEAMRADRIRRAREWRINNPERAAEAFNRSASRRRAVRAATPNVEPGLTWRTVASRDGMHCAYCGKLTVEGHVDHKRWPSLDHVTPLSKGGEHTAANSVLACLSCNSRKHNRDAAVLDIQGASI